MVVHGTVCYYHVNLELSKTLIEKITGFDGFL